MHTSKSIMQLVFPLATKIMAYFDGLCNSIETRETGKTSGLSEDSINRLYIYIVETSGHSRE